MRIASFNVENLFSRVRAMNLKSWSEGKQILDEYSHLNSLLQEPVYTAALKQEILAAIERLDLNQDDDSEFVILRQNRGLLLKRPQSGPPEVVAEGRDAWVGWLELKREAVNEVAIEMTAKVIQDVNELTPDERTISAYATAASSSIACSYSVGLRYPSEECRRTRL